MFKFIQLLPRLAVPKNHYGMAFFSSALSRQRWAYPSEFEIAPNRFLEFFHNISDNTECPFVILDVREDKEIKMADIPTINNNNVEIPKVNIPLGKVLAGEAELPETLKEKVVVCLCHHGRRSERAATFLQQKGFKTQNLEGGINKISEIWSSVPKYSK